MTKRPFFEREGAFFGIVGTGLLLWIAFWGAIIYAAVHFIRKLW